MEASRNDYRRNPITSLTLMLRIKAGNTRQGRLRLSRHVIRPLSENIRHAAPVGGGARRFLLIFVLWRMPAFTEGIK